MQRAHGTRDDIQADVSVCAVIITYNCGLLVEAAVASLIEQVDHVIVVDNGSDMGTRGVLSALSPLYTDRVHIIQLETNQGLGFALNLGVHSAEENGATHVLFMDDDSRMEPGSVEALIEALGEDSDGALGIVAARWITPVSEAPAEDLRVMRVPTAGSLMPLRLFKDLGGFREDYFIDFVDYEFCSRVTRAGYGIRILPSAVLFQRPGRPIMRRFGRRYVSVSNYSAGRLYFIARNGLVLYGHEARHLGFLREHLRSLVVTGLKVVMYEESKIQKLYALVSGCLDGLRHRLGPPTRPMTR